MSVHRDWTPEDPRKAFFPVTVRPAFWMDARDKQHYIPGQKVLVDAERDYPLAVVSERYHLITNEEAYRMADVIVRGVFGGYTLGDFQCYNIMMPSTRSSCRMDFIIPHNQFSAFGDRRESYTPFLRISNSYNRTLVLRYEIGFCRWICLNGCIFGKKSYTATFVHSLQKKQRSVYDAIAEARRTIGSIEDLWADMERKLTVLSGITVPFESALPVFCQVFGVPDVDKEEVSLSVAEKHVARAEHFLEQGRSYYGDLGPNAYALFNTLTDFASFPDGRSMTGTAVHGYQRKVGDWVDGLVAAAGARDFVFDETITNTARTSAKALQRRMAKETVLVQR